MKQVVLYSMKGCPFCDQMKDLLKESNVDYIERDIDEYEREYDWLFSPHSTPNSITKSNSFSAQSLASP